MGHQIRFFVCHAMRTAIEAEAHRTGATRVTSIECRWPGVPEPGVLAADFSYSYSAERYSYSNEAVMTDPIFGHERLDVYRLSIDYVGLITVG